MTEAVGVAPDPELARNQWGAHAYVAIRSERVVKDGRARDAPHYSFISREWPEARRRPEALLDS